MRNQVDRTGQRTSERPVPMHARRAALAMVLAAALAATSCGRIAHLADPFRPHTPHERYATSLRAAGLEHTALGRDWFAAAESELQKPYPVSLPVREAGYFPPDEAHAIVYSIRLDRGQRLLAQVELEGSEPPLLFVDLFEVQEDGALPPQHRASADSGALTLEWEPRRTGQFLLRLQPELLRSARFTLTLRSEAVLAFPVAGRDSRAIGSGFGAPRDGGRRVHHGIDIFAPLGTPVLAAAAGVVTRVDETGLGGKVVWVQDAKRNQSLYYAHLDSQLVRAGARVQPGDTLGTVGNTGNARSTPPHLHFGIYRRGEGAIDPQPWVHTSHAPLPDLAVSTQRLGGWARVAARELTLQREPAQRSASLATLPRHTPLRLMGARGAWYRVLLPDGRGGYVVARSTEPVSRPLRQERLAGATALRDRPAPAAAVIDTLPAGSAVPVLGSFAGFLFVEGTTGRPGWVAE
jgi:peptidoglycan LD-endopeptidase LytH